MLKDVCLNISYAHIYYSSSPPISFFCRPTNPAHFKTWIGMCAAVLWSRREWATDTPHSTAADAAAAAAADDDDDDVTTQ